MSAGASAEAADVLAIALEAGLDVRAAIELAGSDSELHLPPLVVRAVELSMETGAPVAPAARAAADAIRDRSVHAERSASQVAAARASMHLLTGLPLGGPLLCLLLGVPVSAAYGTAMAHLALAAGLVLTALGWFCARALIDRASRPPTVQRPRTTRGSMP